jgi:hypothetical protein
MLELVFGFCFALGLVALAQPERDAERDEILDALDAAHLSQADAARIMRMHRSDLNNALAGLQKLDTWRLAMLPVEFKRWRHVYGLHRVGLPEIVKVAIKIVPTLLDLESEHVRRAVKMGLPEAVEQKKQVR